MAELPGKTVTILLTDVRGSTGPLEGYPVHHDTFGQQGSLEP